jgi:hypothetical protein
MQIRISPVVLICDGFAADLQEKGPHPPELERFPPSTPEELDTKTTFQGAYLLAHRAQPDAVHLRRLRENRRFRHRPSFALLPSVFSVSSVVSHPVLPAAGLESALVHVLDCAKSELSCVE